MGKLNLKENAKNAGSKAKGFVTEFKEFATKGNIVDMAVGVVIGGAFGSIVTSLVNDIIMPLVSFATGKIDFTDMFWALDGGSYATLAEAQAAGAATVNWGSFLTYIINFIIIAFSIFIVLKVLFKAKRKDEPAPAAAPTTKQCPYCKSEIAIDATRCPHCTSEIK